MQADKQLTWEPPLDKELADGKEKPNIVDKDSKDLAKIGQETHRTTTFSTVSDSSLPVVASAGVKPRPSFLDRFKQKLGKGADDSELFQSPITGSSL